MAAAGGANEHVVVIGAGVAGASVAAHLRTSDATAKPEVTVIERGTPGAETTARSAAFFGFYGTSVARRMKRYGLRLYNDLLGAEEIPPMARRHRYRPLGRIRLATTAAGARSLETRADDDHEVTLLQADRLREHVVAPEIDSDPVTAALYRPGVGYFRPGPLAEALLGRARTAGATVRTGEAVTSLQTRDGVASGVHTSQTRIEADHVVCAAGPWTPMLLQSVGVELPLTHSLAPILIIHPDRTPTHPLPITSHTESGVYARAHGDGRVLVGHHPGESTGQIIDPDSVPDEVPEERRALMRDRVGTLLEYGQSAPTDREWVGVRSHTPDSEAIVGETAVSGLSVVAFDSSGIQLAPAAGDLIARQLTGRELPEYADAVRPDRF